MSSAFFSMQAASLTVSWDDNSSDEAGFEVERTTDGAHFYTIATVGRDVTHCVDGNVDLAQTYWYRVRALQDKGKSSYSNVAGGTAPDDAYGSGRARALTGGASKSRLINLSARAIAGGGDQSLIVGFVIKNASKAVMVRAIGPGMAAYTSVPAFSDPQLSVQAGLAFVTGNDNWAGAERLKSAFSQLGAFPLSATSLDAVLLSDFTPRGYTALVKGPGSGIAMAEIYDADTTTAPSGTLINVSVRAQTGTGDNVLIVGFVISGGTPMRVLIRAAGPSLANYGVAGTLANPQVKLYRGGETWDHNDDWGGDDKVDDAFLACGASVWDYGSNDAALLAVLPPGAYTVIVSGTDGGSGVTLAEVYEVP